jgi:toxin ParE1/3/4
MIPIVTEQAVDDLFAIFSHRSETNAQTIVDEIRERIADLEHFPLFGRSRDDLKKGLRAFSVRKYIVFYRIMQNTPVVLRVLHGSQDLERFFDTEL